MSSTDMMAPVGETRTKRSPSVVVPRAESVFCWFSTLKMAFGASPSDDRRVAENST